MSASIELRTARAAIRASIATLRHLEQRPFTGTEHAEWLAREANWLLNGIKAVRLGLEDTLSMVTETASEERDVA